MPDKHRFICISVYVGAADDDAAAGTFMDRPQPVTAITKAQVNAAMKSFGSAWPRDLGREERVSRPHGAQEGFRAGRCPE